MQLLPQAAQALHQSLIRACYQSPIYNNLAAATLAAAQAERLHHREEVMNKIMKRDRSVVCVAAWHECCKVTRLLQALNSRTASQEYNM